MGKRLWFLPAVSIILTILVAAAIGVYLRIHPPRPDGEATEAVYKIFYFSVAAGAWNGFVVCAAADSAFGRGTERPHLLKVMLMGAFTFVVMCVLISVVVVVCKGPL